MLDCGKDSSAACKVENVKREVEKLVGLPNPLKLSPGETWKAQGEIIGSQRAGSPPRSPASGRKVNPYTEFGRGPFFEKRPVRVHCQIQLVDRASSALQP